MINVYDEREPQNIEAFRRLPVFFQAYITQRIYELKNIIFGILQNTEYYPVFTSGFRSPEVNKKVGGVSDSLHLHGLAVDFVLKRTDKKSITLEEEQNICSLLKFNIDNDKYYLLKEKSHYHFQYKRG